MCDSSLWFLFQILPPNKYNTGSGFHYPSPSKDKVTNQYAKQQRMRKKKVKRKKCYVKVKERARINFLWTLTIATNITNLFMERSWFRFPENPRITKGESRRTRSCSRLGGEPSYPLETVCRSVCPAPVSLGNDLMAGRGH